MRWVLIVSDKPSDRQFLRSTFEWNGHYVVEASSSPEGLDQARNCKELDLIVAEASMSLLGGFHLLQVLKCDHKLQKIPFLFYASLHMSQHYRQLALRLGARAFIQKPQSRDSLLAEVRKALLDPRTTGLAAKTQAVSAHYYQLGGFTM